MPKVRYTVPLPGPFSVGGNVGLPKGLSAADRRRMKEARDSMTAGEHLLAIWGMLGPGLVLPLLGGGWHLVFGWLIVWAVLYVVFLLAWAARR